METEEFLKNREKWLREVADHCNDYAEKTNKDFYCFQSSSKIYQPEILLIGINPGGDGAYKKRTWEELNSDPVTLYEKPQWEEYEGADRMRKGLSLIFYNEELKTKLKNTMMINMLFMNTNNSSSAYKEKKDIHDFCRKKVVEYIEISKPKNIIFFTTDKKKLSGHGVTNIVKIEENVNLLKANWKGREVFIIPHYSARGSYKYNKEMCKILGDKILAVL